MMKEERLLMGSTVKVRYHRNGREYWRDGVISSVSRDRTFAVDYVDGAFDIFPFRCFGRDVYLHPTHLTLCLEGMVKIA